MAEEKNKHSLDEVIKMVTQREKTPSEKIIILAKDRDILYDQIKLKENLREESHDDAEIDFFNEQIKSMKEQKALITERIRKLLDET